jgi:hypothetical protein
MRKTEAGERAKALKKEAAATMRAARVTVTNLQALADKKLSYDSGSEAGRSLSMGEEEGNRSPRRKQRPKSSSHMWSLYL